MESAREDVLGGPALDDLVGVGVFDDAFEVLNLVVCIPRWQVEKCSQYGESHGLEGSAGVLVREYLEGYVAGRDAVSHTAPVPREFATVEAPCRF